MGCKPPSPLKIKIRGVNDGNISELLELCTNLQSLDLSCNMIGTDMAQAIAESGILTNLTSLDLSGNHIGDAGVQTIKARYPFAVL